MLTALLVAAALQQTPLAEPLAPPVRLLQIESELTAVPHGWPPSAIAMTAGGFGGAALTAAAATLTFFMFFDARLPSAAAFGVSAGFFALLGSAVVGLAVGVVGLIHGAITSSAQERRVRQLERERRELQPALQLSF